MVPRAADGLAFNQSLGQRPAVVSARRPNGKEILASLNEQCGLAVDVTG
jgi:hypothetical protein